MIGSDGSSSLVYILFISLVHLTCSLSHLSLLWINTSSVLFSPLHRIRIMKMADNPHLQDLPAELQNLRLSAEFKVFFFN